MNILKNKWFLLKQKIFNWYNIHYYSLKRALQNGVNALGVVEVILILVVIIGLILIFKSQLTTILNSLFKSIKTDINNI